MQLRRIFLFVSPFRLQIMPNWSGAMQHIVILIIYLRRQNMNSKLGEDQKKK